MDGVMYRISAVGKHPLEFVAKGLYKQEGADSPGEVIEKWNEIHYRKGYDPHQEVYVQFFHEVKE